MGIVVVSTASFTCSVLKSQITYKHTAANSESKFSGEFFARSVWMNFTSNSIILDEVSQEASTQHLLFRVSYEQKA